MFQSIRGFRTSRVGRLSFRRGFATFLLVAWLGLSLAPLQTIYAAPWRGPSAVITVTTYADEYNTSGSGTGCALREAIRAANANSTFGGCSAGSGADMIVLSAGTYTLTIVGMDENADVTGDLDITSTVTIQGVGANLTFINAAGLGDRVFHIVGVTSATILGVTIKNGQVGSGGGGGLLNEGTLSLISTTVSSNATVGGFVKSLAGGGISNAGTLIAQYTTITGNSAHGNGGGIYNTGTLTLTQSLLSNNTAGANTTGAGGGVYNNSTLPVSVRNSTLSGNAAATDGGGLYILTGTVSLNNTTVVSNTADSDSNGTGDGGGLYRANGTASLSNSLLALNLDVGGQAPNCAGSITSAGYNLVGNNTGCSFSSTTGDQVGTGGSPINPVIGALANNGGSTWTHALQTGSPAIDTANPATPTGSGGTCELADQRSVSRPRDGDGNGSSLCDIGAYEK